jgi:prepilin-type N-terminal cleavage/methylation domain-containing protein
MKKLRFSRKAKSGFTLVELMVVAIIVAILAAVTVPLMRGNTKRAAATEAEAALGTVRTALRVVYARDGKYPTMTDAAVSTVDGIAAGDLGGKYFVETDYGVTSDDTSFTITATGSQDPVGGVVITLDDTGKFTYSGM